jgi:Glycosyl transferases group 1
MRILIVPHAPNHYDQRMVNGLSRGFDKLGHNSIAALSPLPEIQVAELCRSLDIEVVVEINRCRSVAHPLPNAVRHVGWFQDPLLPADAQERIRDMDLLYFLVRANDFPDNIVRACKTGYLALGVDETTAERMHSPIRRTTDFGLAAHIPSPEGWSQSKRELYDLVLQHYRPLRGELDVAALCKLSGGTGSPDDDFDRFHTILSHARLIDRATLIRTVQRVTDSIELYGEFWGEHPDFKPAHHGSLSTQTQLFALYRRCKISLANNNHGVGLHSRTLECMAVGGFIFMHPSPADELPGGIKTAFEPGVHYGEYTADTLEADARYWLRKSVRRWQIGRRASKLVHQKHLWRHRAQQIVSDLS